MVLGFYLALLCVCSGCIFHLQFLGEKHICDQFYLNLPHWMAKLLSKQNLDALINFLVYYHSHSMPKDAIYSILYINVSKGLRPTRRITYKLCWSGKRNKKETEILLLRLWKHMSGKKKTLCHWCTITICNSELKTSYRINARAFSFFSLFYTWYVKASCLILILDNTN